MPEPDRIQDYLRRLTPLSRNNLLTELERLEVCDSAWSGFAIVVEKLRAEFRKDGQTQNRVDNPSRHFFAPKRAETSDVVAENKSPDFLLQPTRLVAHRFSSVRKYQMQQSFFSAYS